MAISLGDISFTLGADTQGLRRAVSDIQRFGSAVERAAEATGDGARKIEADLRRQEKQAISAMQKIQQFEDALRRAGASQGAFSKSTTALQGLVNEMTSGQRTALEFQRAFERFQVTFNNSKRELTAYTLEQKQAAAAAKAHAAEAAKTETILQRQQRTVFAAAEAYKNLEAAARRAQAPASVTAPANAALGTLRTSTTSGPVDARVMQANMQKFQEALNNGKRSLMDFRAQLHPEQVNAFALVMDRVASAAVLIAGPLSGVATRLSTIAALAESTSFRMALFIAGMAGGAYVVSKMFRATIEAEKSLEKVGQTFVAVTGSQSLSSAEMKYAFEVAQRAGVAYSELAQQYARLMAASKETGLEGERTRQIFEGITFASAKLGSSAGDTAGALRAVEQIISKGKVSAEELRGQLGDRLPGAIQIMAQALGVTTAKLDSMLKKGELNAGVLVKFTETLTKRLGIDTTKSIDTTVAAEQRLSNAMLVVYDRFDKALGITSAYRNMLSGLTAAADFAGNNMSTLIQSVGALAGAFAGFVTPALLGGLWSLATAVGTGLVTAFRALTAAIAAANIAMMANPMIALASIVARLALVVGGAVAGYKLMGAAIDTTAASHLKALPNVQAYIQAQTTMKSSIRATTDEYIKQQEVFLKGAESELRAAETSMTTLQKRRNMLQPLSWDPNSGEPAPNPTPVFDEKIAASAANVDMLREKLRQAQADMLSLIQLRDKQAATEKARASFNWGDAEAKGADRMARAVRDAGQAIELLDNKRKALTMAPAQKDQAMMQAEINKQIEDFRDKLTDAKVPLDQITKLTERYKTALTGFKQLEYTVQHTTTVMQALDQVVSTNMDSGFRNLIDTILQAGDVMESLKSIGRQVVSDLIFTFMQLSALNPLKNLLFGTTYNTLGGMGTGGLLGSLFTGAAASGMAVTAGGARYARGGVFSSPTTFQTPTGPVLGGEAGDEALMPLTRDSRGRLSVHAAGKGNSRGMSEWAQRAQRKLHITVAVDGARGNSEIQAMVAAGVQEAIKVNNRNEAARYQNMQLRGRV